jgi:hypothetical protein
MNARRTGGTVSFRALVVAVALITACGGLVTHAQDGFRFKSGVDLVNVTATVTDDDGRFVASLTKDDFTIFENGHRQEISHFSNERTPVSLGIALDASGSMTPTRWPRRGRPSTASSTTCSAKTTSSSSWNSRARLASPRVGRPTAPPSATPSDAWTRWAAPRCTTPSRGRCRWPRRAGTRRRRCW